MEYLLPKIQELKDFIANESDRVKVATATAKLEQLQTEYDTWKHDSQERQRLRAEIIAQGGTPAPVIESNIPAPFDIEDIQITSTPEYVMVLKRDRVSGLPYTYAIRRRGAPSYMATFVCDNQGPYAKFKEAAEHFQKLLNQNMRT